MATSGPSTWLTRTATVTGQPLGTGAVRCRKPNRGSAARTDGFSQSRTAVVTGEDETLRSSELADEQRLAYHEAGHVVASYYVGRPFGTVTIRGPRGSGSVEGASPLQEEPEEIEREIVVLLAGPLAEERLTGRRMTAIDKVAQIALGQALCGFAHAIAS
jgi:ATP-dependent Zn protease